MPQPSESPASAMLKRCSAAVAGLQVATGGDAAEQSIGASLLQHTAGSSHTGTSIGQSKGLVPLHAASVQPQRSQSMDRPPPAPPLLLPVSSPPRLDVSTAPQMQRQQTSVLAHILTHGKLD